ncbi:MAG: Spy/CpxP family protein refolding chaperone [Pyrinomonadaceae bacterium]
MTDKGQKLSILGICVLLISTSSVSAQTVDQQQTFPAVQQRNAMQDPIGQLNLTPEQREKIRSIREQTKAERTAVNERLRETHRALDQALDADSPDEGLVEQRMRDVTAAQAASMRIRILTEVRIRRVLTPVQVAILRTLRQQTGQYGRDRFRLQREQQRQAANDGSALQAPRNRIDPLVRQRRLRRRPRP